MIQPFKNLTIVMAHKTNLGMTDDSHVTVTQGGSVQDPNQIKDIEAFRLKGDLRYTPVVLQSDGLGYALAQNNATHGGSADKPKGAVIGVLLESFDKPMHEHEVMIHGVISMKTGAEVLPGVPVYWDENTNVVTSTVPATQGNGIYYIGLSLTHAPKTSDYVDVLIGK